jgi:serine phosphatase RsbU (regulator of sigma subunit)
MYTDGLIEREDPLGRPFGLRRFRDVLRATRGLPVADVLDALFGAVDRHAGGATQTDDITAVVVQKL